MADRKGPKHRVVVIDGDNAYHWLPWDTIYTLCNQKKVVKLWETPGPTMPKVTCPTCVEKRRFEIEHNIQQQPRSAVRHFLPHGATETACGLPWELLGVTVEDTRMQATCPACKQQDDNAARKRSVSTPEKVLAIYDKAVGRYEKRLQAAAERGRKK